MTESWLDRIIYNEVCGKPCPASVAEPIPDDIGFMILSCMILSVPSLLPLFLGRRGLGERSPFNRTEWRVGGCAGMTESWLDRIIYMRSAEDLVLRVAQ